jgi:hypothetical protein
MQAENRFLSFLPANRREGVRASWYVGATRQLDYWLANRIVAPDRGTQVRFTEPDVVTELLAQILARAHAVAGPPDLLNRCAKPPCDRPGATPVERAVERELQRLAAVRGSGVALLPEVSLLRVRVDAQGSRDLVYAVVRNAAHANVAFLFGEDHRRLPADDTLSVLRGPFGSYPNFLFEIEATEAAAFVDALRAVADDAGFEALAGRYGVRRTDPRIWAAFDWLHAHARRADATEAGLLDLGRYGNW